jgi:hypothetical protein
MPIAASLKRLLLKVGDINQRYSHPRIEMSKAVRLSLLALRVYLLFLVVLLVYKFVLLVG